MLLKVEYPNKTIESSLIFNKISKSTIAANYVC